MYTTNNENKGLVKATWADVRKKVQSVEPEFAAIVDAISPNKSFTVYLAYYPFGVMDADTESTLLPDTNGNYYRVTDKDAPSEVAEDLAYSANNTPLGMVLDKQIESFINLKNRMVCVPWIIYTPGKMFPLSRILHTRNSHVYSPNGLLASVAGSRSAFMLPNIGSTGNHLNLQREFNVRKQPARSAYEHGEIFREIVNSRNVSSDWRCCVLYFSNKWIDSISNDMAWATLKKYLHEKAWQQFEYDINRINYDIIFSIIQQHRNLKPNPYLTDTAKHLFATAVGAAPGYAPAVDDRAMPIKLLQEAFVEVYGLKKYLPVIMQPTYFQHDTDCPPVYYSLQNPSTYVFSPKSRSTSSTLYEMRELEYLMSIFTQEILREGSMCAGTIIQSIAEKVEFTYFHNKMDRHGILKSSQEVGLTDSRFIPPNNSTKNIQPVFAGDSSFLRGCIRMNLRNVNTHNQAKCA